jgi:hypothetical protein
MEAQFHLPRFALAVDGVHMRFQDKPRGLPRNHASQLYWCRKQCYSLNVQVCDVLAPFVDDNSQAVCNDTRICDIDCSWPGSVHDARVWTRSAVKQYWEQQFIFRWDMFILKP